MRACGVVTPESLVTMQSRGCVFVPVENYDGTDARLESNTVLGFIVRQDVDLCSCEVERPEIVSRTLRVEADGNSDSIKAVEDAPSRCQMLWEILGFNRTCIGDLSTTLLIMMYLHWMIRSWGVLV